jgi:hypothetical protein
MKLFKLTLAIAMAALLLNGVTARANTTTFSQTVQEDGVYKWSNSSNWDNGVPTADKRAVVPSNCWCTVYASDANAAADTISVRGILDVQAGRKLTLDNSEATPDNSFVSGTVYLRGFQDSGAALEFKDNNHEISGGGKIIGQHNNAEIKEYSGQSRTLTIASGLTVQGALKVKVYSFVNNGTVMADDGTATTTRDTLELNSGIPSGSGAWKAVRSTGSNDAVLKFRVSATGLTGGFTISADSILDVDADVTSDGTYAHSTFNGGAIDVASGVTLDLR